MAAGRESDVTLVALGGHGTDRHCHPWGAAGMSAGRASARALTTAIHRLLVLHDGPGGLRPLGEPWIPDQRDFARWEDWYGARLRHEAELAEAWTRLHELVASTTTTAEAGRDEQLALDLGRQDACRPARGENRSTAAEP